MEKTKKNIKKIDTVVKKKTGQVTVATVSLPAKQGDKIIQNEYTHKQPIKKNEYITELQLKEAQDQIIADAKYLEAIRTNESNSLQAVRSIENLMRKIDNLPTRATISESTTSIRENNKLYYEKVEYDIRESTKSITQNYKLYYEKIEYRMNQLNDLLLKMQNNFTDIKKETSEIIKTVKAESTQPIVSDSCTIAGIGLILVFLGTFTHNNIVLTLGSGFFVLYAICVIVNKIWSK